MTDLTDTLRRLPYDTYRDLIHVIRATVFTIERDTADDVTVDLPAGELANRLTDDHFESGWYLSFKHKGEDYNLRRPDGVEDGINMQIHVRLFEDGEQTHIDAHRVESPLQHPKLHLTPGNFSQRAEWVAEEYGS